MGTVAKLERKELPALPEGTIEEKEAAWAVEVLSRRKDIRTTIRALDDMKINLGDSYVEYLQVLANVMSDLAKVVLAWEIANGQNLPVPPLDE